jgi:hypothetical protein
MPRGRVTVPSRSWPLIGGRPNPHLPEAIPGGQFGPVAVPSRLTTRVLPPRAGSGPVPGGNHGTVSVFTPAVDKQAPYWLGHNEGFSIRSVEGAGLRWLKYFFANVAGQQTFQPYQSATPDWTSNDVRRGDPAPLVGIPFNRKTRPHVAYRQAAYQDEQLFNQLTSRRHPWPIQRPIPMHLRASLRGQPVQTRPYWPRLTRYTPAASYSQTGRTLISSALSNLLPPTTGGTNPGGSPYGSY